MSPTLAASLSLVGVAIGALLGGIARHVLDARAEIRAVRRDQDVTRRQVDGALRVVVDDLDRIHSVLISLRRADADSLKWSPSEAAAIARSLDPAGWLEVRTLVAREVSVDDWIYLRQAGVQVLGVTTELLLKAGTDATLDMLHPTIDRALSAIRKGRATAMTALGY